MSVGADMSLFERELRELINRHSKENESDTPDFILANYLVGCLHNFNKITRRRNEWYGWERDNKTPLVLRPRTEEKTK